VFVPDTSNPKDPPPLLALLDGGANCNLISNSRARLMQEATSFEEGNITFGNDSRVTITHSLLLDVTAKYEEFQFTFQAKFFICPCSEDMIIGRPTLNTTGLIHLYITDECAPNPFPFAVNSSNIVIELEEDASGELEEEPVAPSEPAFDLDTEDLWESYSNTLGIPYSIMFDLIDWFARNTSHPLHKLLSSPQEYLELLPKDYKKPCVAFKVERESHPDAPWKELNRAVFILQNAFNYVWDIQNRGIAKFRPMHIPFDWNKYKAVRVNAQNLNEPMSLALKTLLDDFESKELIEDVPPEKLATLTTISPLMIHPKKEPNKHRLLWDGKRSGVNQGSLPMSGASPVADEHINRLANHDIVNTADADNFYWQLLLHIDSRSLTAFLTKFGIKQFRVVPQGAKNACAHVSNVVGDAFILEEIQEDWGAYFDDHHGATDFGDSALTKFFPELKLLLQFHVYAIRWNVTFAPKKAKLGYRSVEFLGFVCNKQGKAISKSRISCLLRIKVPNNRDELQQLLGCFVFVAKWMCNFSALAAPLYDLLKKGVRFLKEWSPSHVLAIDALKECAQNAPILKILDYKKPAYFQTDASPLLSISAVLYQIVDGKELPVCYGSKKLTKAQQQWPAVQVEFYSIVVFAREWRMMMTGAEIHMRLDARNLLWAEKSQNLWIRNWYHEVMTFLQIVTVTHVEGKANQPCDGLSRVVNIAEVNLEEEYSVSCLDFTTLQTSTLELVVNEINIDEIVALEQDPSANDVVEEFVNSTGVPMTKLRYHIISLAHNHIVGHAGVSGTCSLLRRANLHKRPCFKSLSEMTELVSCFIKGCPTCQLTWSLLSSRYPMSEMVLHEYFEIIDCDWVYIGADCFGNKEALVVRDRLTRYVETFPSSTATGEEFAKYLLMVSSRYGSPAEVCTDGATVFTAHFIDCFLELLGTKRKKILTYRPTAMPAERSVKDVIRHLRTLVVDRPEVITKWSSFLPIVTSVINDTFCVATQTTPSKMMYGDKVNRIRGILTPHGEPSVRTLSFADEVSTAHAFIMAAAEDIFQHRLQKARSLMPDFDPDTLYRAGEYVVASLPNGEKGKRPKLLPKFRGLFIVLKTEGNNGSSVTCRNVADDTVEVIHAQDLMPIDLRAIENADEIITLAAGLLAVPEWLVSEIHDHRYTATQQKPTTILESELSSLSFRCFYKGLPEAEAWWWNEYKDIKHLTILQSYIQSVRNLIPSTLANGTSFDRATIAQLLTFCRHYNIVIPQNATKQIIIHSIRSRAESN
jgi:hypothetical protein